MSDIRIDDDGFLVGDGEQQRTEAENVLMREIKADTTTIVNLLKGTVKLQRETLKATQNNSSPKPNGGNQQPKVNLVHPNRAAPTPSNAPTPLPPTARPNQQGAGQGAPDTARINRQRDANGRFVGDNNPTQADDTKKPKEVSATERSLFSRFMDKLKNTLDKTTFNTNTDRIDPTIDAIKELGSIASVGIDAGKKALSVSNTLIAKPAMALGRGIKGLFKPKTDAINSPVAWYKRIWLTLRQGNRQDQTQHVQEQRRLDELIRGQGQRGSADSGFLMMLGLGIAALLAAIKNIKFPSLDDIKDKFKGLGTDNQSPVPVVKVPKLNSTIIQANPALKWLSETKVGQTVSKFLKRVPLISSAIEAVAGGINAVNIANDANLTEEQKQRKQSENAGATAGAIGGGLGGAAAGAAIGTALIPIPILGTIIGGVIGGWLGTDAGRIVGNKIGGWVDDLRKADIVGKISQAWTGFIDNITPSFSGIKESIVDFLKPKAEKPIDIIENPPTMKMSPNKHEPPVPIVGNVYADKNSELYKNYQLWKEADTDGNGIITFEEFKKSKYVKQNPALLKKFKPVTPKKPVNDSTQDNYQKYKPLLESVYSQKGFKDSQTQAFLKAQVEAESGFNPNAVSKKGAFGISQFMPETAKQYGVDKNNVQSQVVGQAKYMSYLLKRYGGDWDKALAGYNTGEGNLDKTLKLAKEKGVDWRTLLPKETKDYLVKIKTKALNYGALTDAQIAAQSPTTTPFQPIAKAETVAPPTLKSAPVNAMPIQNVNAVAQVQVKEIQTRLNNTPTPIKVSIQKPIVSQNVSDRGIAHIVTGGIGEAM